MRKILGLFAAISIFASCNSDNKTTETTKEVVGVSDSNLYRNNAIADTGTFAPTPAVAPVTAKTVAPIERVSRPKTTVKRITPKPVVKTTTTTTTENTSGGTGSTSSEGTTTTPSTTTGSTTPEVAPEKKGWSNAAKGATIGGVGGAIGGAIISKKKGKGAIIGGAVGAAGGYILGRKKDKAQQRADTAR